MNDLESVMKSSRAWAVQRILPIFLMAISCSVFAGGVYRCDREGVVEFTDRPCGPLVSLGSNTANSYKGPLRASELEMLQSLPPPAAGSKASGNSGNSALKRRNDALKAKTRAFERSKNYRNDTDYQSRGSSPWR